MYQNTMLLQTMNDRELAERRRRAAVRHEIPKRPDASRRVTRPLARLFSH